LAVFVALAVVPAPLLATWSIIAVDARTGRVVIASATCVPQSRLVGFPAEGLMDVQAIVVPGVGVAAAQAGVDRTRANQRLIYAELKRGTDPAEILSLLSEDPDFQRRQFGIVDLEGRMAGFSGAENRPASLSVQGRLPDQEIYFSIQGNILASDDVVYDAAHRFMTSEGTLTDRVMSAMEGADEAGGDVRCTCETEPVPEAPCHGRNAHVAYLLAADPNDREGEGVNDGEYFLYINVTDENIAAHEDANPVLTLRQRYGAWKVSRRGLGQRTNDRHLPEGGPT
jgi:uncharacterized Ntn-hydrolase superfamily protein